ncbi:MAG: PDZ domain-containing protein, partial [Candidatus Sericytochromatia bacterium]
ENVKNNLPFAKLGDSNKISVGEWVLAIGNPLGLTSTVTSGIISAKGRADVGVADFEDFIQTDAAINPGNSGGALINLRGEVIGINTAIASRTGGYMGIGFAIPSNMAKKIMNDLVTKGKVSRGFLGIQIQDMNENFAKSLKADNANKGIVVVDVFKDSPAEKSGMERYDVILELNSKEVTSVSSFRNQIASMNPGESAKLLVLRDGKKINVEIKLSELDSTKLDNKDQAQSKIDTGVLQKLGFKAEELNKGIKEQLGLDKNIYGLVIYEVNPSSNASEAGVSKGDIIQEINRKKVVTKKDFEKALSELKSGDSVLLKVLRGKGSLLIAFTLP